MQVAQAEWTNELAVHGTKLARPVVHGHRLAETSSLLLAIMVLLMVSAVVLTAVVAQRHVTIIRRISQLVRIDFQEDPIVVRHLNQPGARLITPPGKEMSAAAAGIGRPADHSALIVLDRVTASAVLDPAVIDLEAVNVGILVRLVVDVFQIQLDVQPIRSTLHHDRLLMAARLAETVEQVAIGHQEPVKVLAIQIHRGALVVVSSGLALADRVEHHLPDDDADAVIVATVRSLEPVATLELPVAHQKEPIADQVDRPVGILQDPVAQSVGHRRNFFRQEHVEQAEIHLGARHGSSQTGEPQLDAITYQERRSGRLQLLLLAGRRRRRRVGLADGHLLGRIGRRPVQLQAMEASGVVVTGRRPAAGQLVIAFRMDFQPNAGGRERPGAVDVAREPVTRRHDGSLLIKLSAAAHGRDGMVTRRDDAVMIRPLPPLVAHTQPESLMEEPRRRSDQFHHDLTALSDDL